jgi:putative copper resistance protein D
LTTLFDIFGFLSVILHGVDLVAQTVLLGSISFALFVVAPLARRAENEISFIQATTRYAIVASAVATVVAILTVTLLNATVLAATLQVPWEDVAGAAFVIEGALKALAAGGICLLVSLRPLADGTTRLAIVLLGTIVLCAAVGSSHAAARLSDSALMMVATGAHELGAAIWLGGLPCFRAALGRVRSPETLSWIGRRYSALSIAGVALIVAGATGFAIRFIGSIDGIYGTAYGAMAATKSILFGMMLLLGFANFRAVRRFTDDSTRLPRVRRFVEVEMGIGFAVLMAAASITSMPPAVDLVADRVTLSELEERMTPTLPRLESPEHAALAIPALQARLDDEWRRGQESARAQAFLPGTGVLPPRNAQDIAWSEYNHHWAGLLVLIVGIAALARRSGPVPWAKHWPLLFLALAAFLFFRADPEVWPMGDIGFFESLKDPEVAQHRIFVLLIIVFAWFEWRVRTGRITSRGWMRVFPLLTALGGTLLLTHSHALANVKEELLVEATHLPIAVLGITAGWARWLEIEAPEEEGRWTGWLWPLCFVLIGALLLAYREA